MKILSLKYKMHRLVNLVFYLAIFIFGFLLGFATEKININELISNFLFIENVNAEELVCTDGENLFDITKVTNSTPIIDKPADFYIDGEKLTVQHSSTWRFVDYEIKLQPGIYNAYIKSTTGHMKTSQFWKKISKVDGTLSYEYIGALNIDGLTFELEEETDIIIRFYNSHGGTPPYMTEYIGVSLHKQICTSDIMVEIVNDSFYSFSQKLFGEVNEENLFIYDFITLGLVCSCFILFILIVGYIIKKFFGG